MDAPRSPRLETDSMDPVDVPADRWWGAQMERSRRNFRIGDADLGLLPVVGVEAQTIPDHVFAAAEEGLHERA